MDRKKQNMEHSHKMRIAPLGVTKVGEYFNFVVSVPNADECKLKIYISGEKLPVSVTLLTEEHRFGSVFQILVKAEDIVGDCYMYEAFGKEFIDPYAKKISGRDTFGKNIDEDEKALVRGVIIDDEFQWGEENRPSISYTDMILYKLHVRGFTKQEASGVRHKGTYLGVVEKIKYLKELGVNAVLLMPVIDFNEIMEEESLSYGAPNNIDRLRYQRTASYQKSEVPEKKVKVNYWGYGKESFFFAPKASYAANADEATKEFKKMVLKLHQSGIEVLMDMSFPKGMNVLMILECLRYWVAEYHIDGFRINTDAQLEVLIATDPYLARIKLLATYWNTEAIYGREASVGYRNLAEYNDGFLVDIRRFIKGDEGQVSSLQERFRKNRETCGSINYVTDHNGFTLYDLYAYDVKHNETNEENNRDGTEYNYSWNCGVEGDTRKKKVKEQRMQMIKNALLLLLLSQGTPMILSGDEFCNSQQGNNNAYCQDNDIGWVDWSQKKKNREIFEFVKELIALRKAHLVLHNPIELRAMDYIACGYPDISYHGVKAWYPDYSNYSRTFGIMLCGKYAIMNHTMEDKFFYFAFNMHWEAHSFDLPDLPRGREWSEVVRTNLGTNHVPKRQKGKASMDLDTQIGMLTKAAAESPFESSTISVNNHRRQVVVEPRSILVFVEEAVSTKVKKESK